MKKSQRIMFASAICVLALGSVAAITGPFFYRDFIASTPAAAPMLNGDSSLADESLDSPTQVALDPAQLAGTWTLAKGSEAGYRVDEVLGGTDVTVTGHTSEVTGSLKISDDGLTLEAAEFTVDVASIATDRSQRDAYFRDQAIRVADYPEATFVLSTPVSVEALPEANEVVNLEAQGDLTIAGETQSVAVAIQLRSDGSTAELAGSIPITFADYGVQAPSLGFVKVEDTGFVEFQLVAARE